MFSIIYCFAISLLSFNAIYKPAFLGSLGSSPGLIIISILIPLIYINKSIIKKFEYIWLCATLLIGNLYYISAIGINEYYLDKGFTLLILCLVWISPIFVINQINKSHLKIAINTAISISVFGIIFSDLMNIVPDEVNNFLFNSKYTSGIDLRPKGFFTEPSIFSTVIIRLIFCKILLNSQAIVSNNRKFLIQLFFLILFSIFLGSKGCTISLILSTAIALFLTKKSVANLIIYIPIISIIYISFNKVYIDIISDITNYTSFATRLTTGLSAVLAFINNPFGYGTYAYTYAFTNYGDKAIDILNIFGLNLYEIKELIDETMFISFKSTILDLTVIFGLSFLYLIFKITKKINLNDIRVITIYLFLLISSLYTDGSSSFSLFLGLAIILKYFPKIKNNKVLYVKGTI